MDFEALLKQFLQSIINFALKESFFDRVKYRNKLLKTFNF